MGLDSCWQKPGESRSVPLDFDPPLRFECDEDRFERIDGSTYFHSRAVRHLIKEITGISLYERRLDNATVRSMAETLAKYAANPWQLAPSGLPTGWEHWASRCHLPEIVGDLARMFRAYGEAGYELLGDW